MDTEIQKRIERKGIVISRIPDWAKELFISRAQEEFCDDYGMCLAALIKESGEYNQLKSMFFNNQLNAKIILDENKIDEDKGITFGNGKKLNPNGGKK